MKNSRISAAAVNIQLNIEEEVNNVAVLHDVILALGADKAFFSCNGKRAAFHKVIKADDLGSDKAFFKVGMYFSDSLRSFGTLFNRSCTNLGLTGRQIRDKSEQVVAALNEKIKTALLNAEVGKEHFLLFLAEACNFGFHLGANREGL